MVVIEDGRIVEDGDPALLSQQTDGRYHNMLEAEENVREGLWASDEWQRFNLVGGQPDLRPATLAHLTRMAACVIIFLRSRNHLPDATKSMNFSPVEQ